MGNMTVEEFLEKGLDRRTDLQQWGEKKKADDYKNTFIKVKALEKVSTVYGEKYALCLDEPDLGPDGGVFFFTPPVMTGQLNEWETKGLDLTKLIGEVLFVEGVVLPPDPKKGRPELREYLMLRFAKTMEKEKAGASAQA